MVLPRTTHNPATFHTVKNLLMLHAKQSYTSCNELNQKKKFFEALMIRHELLHIDRTNM
jgi:hypothetical protein